MHAPDGTIAMRRLTMENLRRFQTLRHFFQKSPYGSGKPPQPGQPPKSNPQSGGAPPANPAVPQTHRWAHAFQNVNNHGGHSFLNVWDPPIGANQIFSLSQHWYTAGSGDNLQTAEVGWQVYPKMYKNTRPVFFIYWTADNYKSLGCYNLTCPAFVQTNSTWAIGGAISPWSVAGGVQKEIEVTFFLTGGNWWVYVGGGAAGNAIGYYPTSLYRNGAMATQATGIDYGGETVGTTSWPPMGGGAFANQGWQHAAYQRDIRYFPSAGGNVVASVTPAQASPQCYTVSVSKLNPPWNETIYFGGPGGNNCYPLRVCRFRRGCGQLPPPPLTKRRCAPLARRRKFRARPAARRSVGCSPPRSPARRHRARDPCGCGFSRLCRFPHVPWRNPSHKKSRLVPCRRRAAQAPML